MPVMTVVDSMPPVLVVVVVVVAVASRPAAVVDAVVVVDGGAGSTDGVASPWLVVEVIAVVEADAVPDARARAESSPAKPRMSLPLGPDTRLTLV